MTDRYCIIMCGGVGSRFWPSSRQAKPKQFIDFMGTGRSLLQMTFDRVLEVVPADNVIIVTNGDYAGIIHRQLPEVKPENILLEPARRNTAPCLAWAVHHIAAINPEASILVTPADHLIMREREFHKALRRGFDFVEANDALLTLGIEPSRPETGYGYIQVGKPVNEHICKVKTFTEKPDLELAKVFLASGDFKWNSGVFMWTAQSFLKALAENSPELARRFEAGEGKFGTELEADFIAREFPACPAISIDYALMEKASNVFVEAVDPGWSDLGTWSALRDNSPKNSLGNVTQGCQVVSYDTSGTVFSVDNPRKVVVVDGLKDYVVADTGDVLLICPLAHEQQIKQYVNDVKSKFNDSYL
ncbi:MAG: mannose-1-phosphate guanylyltransferase [Bacteroides sp.]|nr:mannose-1-phosphate guanylyltransferase [Bacteroides sp.]